MRILARIGIAIVFALTLPLYYFLGASAGLVPWFGILLISFLPAFRLGYFVLAVNMLELLIYFCLLFGLACIVERMITSFERQSSRAAALALIVAGSLITSSFPLYSISHASVPHGTSAFSLYVSILKGHVL
jgi:hypothetical protein